MARRSSKIKAESLDIWMKDFVAAEIKMGINWPVAAIERARTHLLERKVPSRNEDELKPVGTRARYSELGGIPSTGDDTVVIVGHVATEDGGWTELTRNERLFASRVIA